MHAHLVDPRFDSPASFWHTTSFSETAGISAGISGRELSALAEHLNLCKKLSGHLFNIRCIAETMNGFVAARFVTSLALFSLVMGVAALIL